MLTAEHLSKTFNKGNDQSENGHQRRQSGTA